MKVTTKEVFENDSWIITKLWEGRVMVRVDAKRRFHVADGQNFYSEWRAISYVNRLCYENYGKPLKEMNSRTL